MKILDITAGYRAVWFDKRYRDCLYIDIRKEVNPDIVADSTHLPAKIGHGYSLIIFDPPHKNNGINGAMAKRYGHYTGKEIKSFIRAAAKEAWRVSRKDALMSFKWNDNSKKLKSVLKILDHWWEPLVGHGVNHSQRQSKTTWVLLRKRQQEI